MILHVLLFVWLFVCHTRNSRDFHSVQQEEFEDLEVQDSEEIDCLISHNKRKLAWTLLQQSLT
jgi:hypothetical protein